MEKTRKDKIGVTEGSRIEKKNETRQLINRLECLLPYFVKLLNTKDNNKNIIWESYYSKIK